jgi:hypothetical protein
MLVRFLMRAMFRNSTMCGNVVRDARSFPFGKLHPFHSSVLSFVSFVCATETSSNQPKLLVKMRYFAQASIPLIQKPKPYPCRRVDRVICDTGRLFRAASWLLGRGRPLCRPGAPCRSSRCHADGHCQNICNRLPSAHSHLPLRSIGAPSHAVPNSNDT